MDILDLSDLWISFNVREDQLGDFKMGETFEAVVPALGHKEIELKVTYLKDMGSYAAWRATKTTGQYDIKTFQGKSKAFAGGGRTQTWNDRTEKAGK